MSFQEMPGFFALSYHVYNNEGSLVHEKNGAKGSIIVRAGSLQEAKEKVKRFFATKNIVVKIDTGGLIRVLT